MILVAARDEERTIAATVAALAEQFPDAEMIVADDGSRDATAAEAERAGARVLRLPRRGKGQALTLAERECPPGALVLALFAGPTLGFVVGRRDDVDNVNASASTGDDSVTVGAASDLPTLQSAPSSADTEGASGAPMMSPDMSRYMGSAGSSVGIYYGTSGQELARAFTRDHDGTSMRVYAASGTCPTIPAIMTKPNGNVSGRLGRNRNITKPAAARPANNNPFGRM